MTSIKLIVSKLTYTSRQRHDWINTISEKFVMHTFLNELQYLLNNTYLVDIINYIHYVFFHVSICVVEVFH